MKTIGLTSRERVWRALRFQEVDRIPIENSFGGELELRYPADVARPPCRYPSGRSWGVENVKGRRMDIWGCVWESGEDGVCGEVKQSPLQTDWTGLDQYQPPWEVLDGADLSQVNSACAASTRFMLPMWGDLGNSPFERMQHLRGTEQLLMDLADLEPELYRLRDLVHAYFMRQVAMWCRTDVDAIHLADDWGTQRLLLISPALWREFFKPLYRDYCRVAHAHGKAVLMHSDGYIIDIIPDLIEIGINAVNAQLFCMPIETLAERFAGKICFWGEIDRQRLMPNGTTDEIRQAVRRVAAAMLRDRRTGVVGQRFDGKGHRREEH
jgi:hypothetical protein